MTSVPERPDGKRRAADRPLTDAELRADAILAEIPDDELDALARTLARVLLSAARNRIQHGCSREALMRIRTAEIHDQAPSTTDLEELERADAAIDACRRQYGRGRCPHQPTAVPQPAPSRRQRR